MEDGDEAAFLLREEWAGSGSPCGLPLGVDAPRGRKSAQAPLRQGIKRRSHPLPTKAIDEAAEGSGPALTERWPNPEGVTGLIWGRDR